MICIVAAIFANFLLPNPPAMLTEAKSYPPLLDAGNYIIGLLPDDLEKQFKSFLDKRNQDGDASPNDTGTDSTTPDGASSAPASDASSSSAPAA